MRPYPGERGFTGVPPADERRFITTELVFQAGPNVTQAQIDEMARRHNCLAVSTQRSSLTGGTLIRFRIAGGQDAAEMVRAMEADRLGIAVRTVRGYGDRTIAEHAFALIMAGARGLARMDREIRRGEWIAPVGVELAGKRLGVIGERGR